MKAAFSNDPFSVVCRAFHRLYPGITYRAQVTYSLRDENGATVYGQTTFPDGGGRAEILVSCEAPYQDMVEVLANELAHVAAGCKAEHNAAWEASFDAIHREYMRMIGGK